MKPSPAVFSLAYCCGYALVFRLNLPLFRYYPVAHQWAWGATDVVVRPGPAVVWYGLVVSAALIAGSAMFLAAVATTVSGDRRPLPTLTAGLWLGPWLAATYCVFLLRHFFL